MVQIDRFTLSPQVQDKLWNRTWNVKDSLSYDELPGKIVQWGLTGIFAAAGVAGLVALWNSPDALNFLPSFHLAGSTLTHTQDVLVSDATITGVSTLAGIVTSAVGGWFAAIASRGDDKTIEAIMWPAITPLLPLAAHAVIPVGSAYALRKGIQLAATGATMAINGIEGAARIAVNKR